MRREALDLLACPVCHKPLSILPVCEADGDVTAGSLSCPACGASYPIRNGLPDFLLPECLRRGNRLSRALYNAYSSLYDPLEAFLAKIMGFSEPALREEIASYLELAPSSSVLEVCVGTGGNIPYIRARTRGPIFGLDISEKMLKVCLKRLRQLGLRGVHLSIGCAERLPLASSAFDRVLIGGGISYFDEPGKALEEAARVLKPGGLLVVFEQVTLLEKALGRADIPLKLAPPGLRPLQRKWLFRGAFYLVKLVREA